MAIINQIYSIVNDAVTDALGTQSLHSIDTTDFVSMGKALAEGNLYERWYGSLVNRLTKTIFAVRDYEPSSRSILRDEDAFGAFKQKVHYNVATAVANPAQAIPVISGNPETRTYTQASPYDVNTTLQIKALVFGITEMINEGIDIDNEDNNTSEPFVSHKKVGRMLTEIGIEKAAQNMNDLVVKSTKDDSKNE
jgi:hypothetical protein